MQQGGVGLRTHDLKSETEAWKWQKQNIYFYKPVT
jgi:hypothetical protein